MAAGIASTCRLDTFAKGSLIFSEFEKPNAGYLLTSGTVVLLSTLPEPMLPQHSATQ